MQHDHGARAEEIALKIGTTTGPLSTPDDVQAGILLALVQIAQELSKIREAM
jgi:hypothetical protein